MKKNFLRIGAFLLDTILVSLICLIINYVPFLNPNKAKIEKYSNEEQNYYQDYLSLISDLGDYSEDDELTDEELTKLKNYEFYNDAIVEYTEDTNLDDYVTEIKTNTYEILTSKIKDCNYNISKYSWYQSLVSVAIYIIYFGVIQYLLKGQTLFKKLFKLRVVSNNANKSQVPFWNYLLRSILISESIFIILDVILIKTLGKASYTSVDNVVTEIRTIYELAFLLVIILKEDSRGIQDLILNTKVVRYNKNGEIIPDVIINSDDELNFDNDNKKENVEEKDVSNTKKSSTKNSAKKNTTKKSTTKKNKEVVKAEKVDD